MRAQQPPQDEIELVESGVDVSGMVLPYLSLLTTRAAPPPARHAVAMGPFAPIPPDYMLDSRMQLLLTGRLLRRRVFPASGRGRSHALLRAVGLAATVACASVVHLAYMHKFPSCGRPRRPRSSACWWAAPTCSGWRCTWSPTACCGCRRGPPRAIWRPGWLVGMLLAAPGTIWRPEMAMRASASRVWWPWYKTLL